ncbi:MAG TPA: hypothetical protein VE913_03175 [Longimicrobium sp.]|nr:hypothetical protein [Longimicrobium sp.]
MKARVICGIAAVAVLAACADSPTGTPAIAVDGPRYDSNGGWTIGSGGRASDGDSITTRMASADSPSEQPQSCTSLGGWTIGTGVTQPQPDPCEAR